jgi:hypothetical protein
MAILLPQAICPLAHAQSAPEPREPWKPVASPMLTGFASKVSPENALPEYPRPQLVRANWLNLNGLWDCAITGKDDAQPARFDGAILVPYPVESALSGVARAVTPQQRLWYRRTFRAPALPDGRRLLLHFGAVDWHAVVRINGSQVGEHKGGYDAFTFDITDTLRPDAEQNEIVVSVWDPTDTASQPRGKQVLKPDGIWYTAVTGIWQTVWLEVVPHVSIDRLTLVPDIDEGVLRISAQLRGPAGGYRLEVSAVDEGRTAARAEGDATEPLVMSMNQPQLWTPDTPRLYDLFIKLTRADGQLVEQIMSYFAMRKVSMGRADDGFTRLMLNNKPIFMFGPLDQGFWPDGVYTPPTDEAMKFDIEMTRKLGFNMCRKHIKVEPARWYYWADRLGLMVWQDMPSAMGANQQVRAGERNDVSFSDEEDRQFRVELKAMIDALQNHPSIVAWVPFNEGWGQHDTNEILEWTKKYDPTRLVDGPSGWEDRGFGDMHDRHHYPGPGMFKTMPGAARASVLGEFGGLGWPAPGHLWQDGRNWGYRTHSSQAALQEHYEQLIRQLRPLVAQGLAAAVYTQTTDVEGEVNGLLTYDRMLVKLDAERIAALHRALYDVAAMKLNVAVLLPTSESEPQTWRYTTERPQDEAWHAWKFDDSAWNAAPGGFGTAGTPNTHVRTRWSAGDIWLRRTFPLRDLGQIREPWLRIYHDEDAEVYLNGTLVCRLFDHNPSYMDVPLDTDTIRRLLKSEGNVLAIHCRQTRGGQYIDAGLIDMRP